jgi:hypothetical protein
MNRWACDHTVAIALMVSQRSYWCTQSTALGALDVSFQCFQIEIFYD